MSNTATLAKASQSRVYVTKNRSAPDHKPAYKGFAAAQGFSWSQGDISPIRVPSATRYGEFDTVDVIRGQRGLPQLPVMFRSELGASSIFELMRVGCPVDLFVLQGECENPSDFGSGWHDGRILVMEQAYITDYSTSVLGALDADAEAMIDETTPFTAMDAYQVVPLIPGEVAGAEVTDPIVAVVICDSISCGSCGDPSDGCEKVFALTAGTSGSPGLALEVLWSKDKGVTWNEDYINSAALGDAGVEMICAGDYLVAFTDNDEHHYINIDDLIAGTGTWTLVSGYAAAGSPNAGFALSGSMIWAAGDGGYVWYLDDPSATPTAQTSGDVTTEDLADIDGDDDVLVAVGGSNAVIVSENAGASWSLITGPAVGVNLTAVAVLNRLSWQVGDADGNLWYTRDGGLTWTQKAFSGDGDSTAIGDIAFVNGVVGYMAHGTRVLRTVNGGYSWSVQPEESSFIFPTATAINSIGVCSGDANLYFAGGADSSDGVLIKAVGVGL